MELFNGGKIPLNNSHSVIERPELVSLVKPPTMIIKKTNNIEILNQYKNNLFIFFSFENIIYNIYFID